MAVTIPEVVRFTDEIDDTVISLDLVARLLPDSAQEPRLWKWIIIGAHSGLQGAMVCALSTSDSTGSLTEKTARKVRQSFEDDFNGDYPYLRMEPFLELLKSVGDPKRVEHGPPLELRADEERDLFRLNNFRSGFTHFTPQGWSILATGLPRIILTAVSSTERLMLGNERIVARLGEDREQHLEGLIKSIREALS